MFVQIKQGSDTMRENESKLNKLSSECELQSVKLLPSSVKDAFFDEKDNPFGRFSEIIIPKSIEHVGDFSVRLQSDKMSHNVRDFCLTTGGSIICTDYYNQQLKKLDNSYNVIEHLGLSSSPIGLCEVDSSQLAVTLKNDKKVQFVSQQPLKLGRWFTVGDCCRGIICQDAQLYVCCGGYKDESQGHIEVCDLNGGLLRTFYEGLSCPFYIKAASDGEWLLADKRRIGNDRVLKLNAQHLSMSEIITDLTGLSGFCRIGDDQMLISSYSLNNIVLISEDAEQQKELLTVKDGIIKPLMVFCNEKQSQLLVSLENSEAINVYHVMT